MTVRVVKKKIWSTASPISEASACFVDASPSPSLWGTAGSVLLFFRRRWRLSYFVLTVFCRFGNLYLHWRELDRLQDDPRFICSHEGWKDPAWCRGIIITSSLAERLCFVLCFAFALPCPFIYSGRSIHVSSHTIIPWCESEMRITHEMEME